MRSPSGSLLSRAGLFRDHTAHRIEPLELEFELTVSDHAGIQTRPFPIENSLIEDIVVPMITHDAENKPSTKFVKGEPKMGFSMKLSCKKVVN